MRLFTAKQMRDLDARTITEFGIPGQVLMENAARGAVDAFFSHFAPKRSQRICFCCGPGNNGGDGFVMARYLADAGYPCTVLLFTPSREKISGDAALNLQRLDDLPVRLIDIDPAETSAAEPYLKTADYIIDGIFGTGLNTDVRGGFKTLIEAVNRMDIPVFSLDIPSGLHADISHPCGVSIIANATATFGGIKPGLVQHPGCRYTGTLYTVDIGIPARYQADALPGTWLIGGQRIRNMLPARPSDAHKGTSGHLLIIGGASEKTGASRLSTRGALRSGAGLVTLTRSGDAPPPMDEVMSLHLDSSSDSCLTPNQIPMVISHASDKQAIAVGPGLGTAEPTRQAVRDLLAQTPCPIVLDADALNCIQGETRTLKTAASPIIITPHPKEFSRLTGLSIADIQKNRLETARAYACDHQVTLVLKGAGSLIALPDGSVFINPTGNPGMATAGMGDVLTGIIGGLLAQGLSPDQAAIAGVYLHGLAGDTAARTLGPAGFTASEVADLLPAARNSVARSDASAPENSFSPLLTQTIF